MPQYSLSLIVVPLTVEDVLRQIEEKTMKHGERLGTMFGKGIDVVVVVVGEEEGVKGGANGQVCLRKVTGQRNPTAKGLRLV